MPSSEYEQVRRAIVVVNSHNTLAKLRRNKFPTRVLEHNVFSLSYTLHLFHAACSEATAELVGFTTQACEEINYMVYEGRLRPSVSKMHYLRHLEDCHRVAKDCCKANRSTLQSLLDQVNCIQGPRANEEAKQVSDLEIVLSDLDYLHDEIELSLQRIPDVRRDLQENLDLLQIRRTTVLGILAALYLPLSFVASFLGMNLDQISATQPFWRNATVTYEPNSKNHSIPSDNFSTGSHNITSRIDDAGEIQTWSLANFFMIAMPLMVETILVPLVIGSLIRAFLQGLAQGRTWWRLLLALIVICYSFVTPAFLTSVPYLIPFWIFLILQFFVIFRSDRTNWNRIMYWLANMIWSVIIMVVNGFYPPWYTIPLMTGTHALSLFVFWWWKPEFYYSWDQGRRPKPKED
ncbi:hypothetical protein BJX61DRAFT_507990 [Aspergillus egyptiacus]|nr:hypothetical protein BJX61DRAFT_507990 [Aspergillus egyptiacus]